MKSLRASSLYFSSFFCLHSLSLRALKVPIPARLTWVISACGDAAGKSISRQKAEDYTLVRSETNTRRVRRAGPKGRVRMTIPGTMEKATNRPDSGWFYSSGRFLSGVVRYEIQRKNQAGKYRKVHKAAPGVGSQIGLNL